MNDKTRGEYKRTTPDPDETTGEALARLQAQLTRLLDEADAELRDEADGGVAAALIEKEVEQRDAPEARPLTPHAIPSETVERARAAWINAGGRVYAGLTLDLRHALAAALPVAPDAMTAREHLDAARRAGHPLPKGATIPEGAAFWVKAVGESWEFMPQGPHEDFDTSPFPDAQYVLVDPPTPARPGGAEEIEFLIADRLGGDVPGDVIRALADEIAERAGATRLYPEDGAA